MVNFCFWRKRGYEIEIFRNKVVSSNCRTNCWFSHFWCDIDINRNKVCFKHEWINECKIACNEYLIFSNIFRRRHDKKVRRRRVFEKAAERFLGRPLWPNEDYLLVLRGISVEKALREILLIVWTNIWIATTSILRIRTFLTVALIYFFQVHFLDKFNSFGVCHFLSLKVTSRLLMIRFVET